MPQSLPAAGHHRRPDARPCLADSLENPRDDLDRLIRDMRLGTRPSARSHDDFEERAQMIAAAIVAPFRGARDPSASPLRVDQADGKCSAWF